MSRRLYSMKATNMEVIDVRLEAVYEADRFGLKRLPYKVFVLADNNLWYDITPFRTVRAPLRKSDFLGLTLEESRQLLQEIGRRKTRNRFKHGFRFRQPGRTVLGIPGFKSAYW